MTFLVRYSRPTALATLAVALLLLTSGCGRKAVNLEGPEGAQINLGGLVYQVQLSRQLNPDDEEDRAYTRGMPATGPNQTYYGVFLRVENQEGKAPLTPVPLRAMTIHDTSGRVFTPLAFKNPGLSYEPVPLPKGARLPLPNSAGDQYPTRGSLVLFRVTFNSMEDRPLVLWIKGPGGKVGRVTLDV